MLSEKGNLDAVPQASLATGKSSMWWGDEASRFIGVQYFCIADLPCLPGGSPTVQLYQLHPGSTEKVKAAFIYLDLFDSFAA